MVSVIIFVLLLNLTYVVSQDNIPHERDHDNLQYERENPPKVKDLTVSITEPLANKNSDQKKIDHFKLPTDPFSGKGVHNVTDRQVEKGNTAIDQNQKKLNNENQVIVPKIQHTKDVPNQKEVINPSSSTNPPKEIKNNSTITENKNLEKSSTLHPTRINSKDVILQSGPLLRGFYVFLGLSTIIMIYFIFRSYRLRHGAQPSTTVRKYGVTARRSDMEMRPLELDDDDDDTLFEIGNNQNANR